MKVKGIEGTPQEIHDLFKNNGLDINKYISAPLAARWVIVPAVVLVLVLLVMVFGPVFYEKFATKCLAGVVVAALIAVVWLAIATQVRFESATGTLICLVGGVVIILVAAGVMTPSEALTTIKDFKK
ncbi:hypothetical protein [Pseudomonas sp. NFIX28]|uniref:hypothetical protein n=1 Tax=Pseudomonas sp. NFIX28 TaxID=1566235 RepID=UPI000B80D21E|nr:hypothetical protein [Pseudomonas sp. NFIX28]